MRLALWTGMFPTLQVEDAVREIRLAGFTAAELAGHSLRQLSESDNRGERSAKLKTLCDKIGLTLSQAHGPSLEYASPDNARRETACRSVEAILPLLKMLEIGAIVLHAGAPEDVAKASAAGDCPWMRCWRRCLTQNAASFKRLVESAASFNVRVAVENKIDEGHMGRRTFGAHPLDLEALLDLVPGLGLALDTAHAHAQALDVEQTILEFGDRLFALHVADNCAEPHDRHLTPGKGTINWRAVILALKKVGYDGDFHLELPHERGDSIAATRQAAAESAKATRALLDLSSNDTDS